jgi:hypothetical protein
MQSIDGHGRSTRRRTRAWAAFARRLIVMAPALAGACAAAALLPAGALAGGSALGPPAGPKTAPFTQCPAIGLDASCEFLIDVTSADPAHPTVLRDRKQPFYDGEDDVTVGVQNDTSSPVAKLHLGVPKSGDRLFELDGDGMCWNPVTPKPPECPFSANTYDGPDTNLVAESADAGTVFFNTPLAPGQYTYFTLESVPGEGIVAGEADDLVVTTLTDTETGEQGQALSEPSPVAVSDRAQVKGEFESEANGEVEYLLYRDRSCHELVESLGRKKVVAGVGEPSNPSSTKLPTNATYYWIAEYLGFGRNSRNRSACGAEAMTFGAPQALPAAEITTVLSGEGRLSSSITVWQGSPVADTAIVTAPGGQPVSGRVTYAVYSGPACTAEVSGVGGGGYTTGVGPSTNTLTLAAGTYYFRAFYSGSSQLQSASTPCGEEVLTVLARPKPPPAGKAAAGKPPAPGGSHVVTGSFQLLAYRLNRGNGQIVFTVKAPTAGTVTVDAVIPHGATLARVAQRSAAHARSRHCKRGFVAVKGRCTSNAPALYGAAALTSTAAGNYTIVLRPIKRVLQALRHGRTLDVAIAVIFRSRSGGAPEVRLGHEVVKLQPHMLRPHHH